MTSRFLGIEHSSGEFSNKPILKQMAECKINFVSPDLYMLVLVLALLQLLLQQGYKRSFSNERYL